MLTSNSEVSRSIRVFVNMFCRLFICALLIGGKAVLSTNLTAPGPLTREVGQDVVFMVNSTAMREATWGVRDGNTEDLNPKFIRVLNPEGARPDSQLDSTRYAGRVSYVGDLTKGQAWFKITNLNINDNNTYMMKIMLKANPSRYRNIPIQLTVVQPATTTADPSTKRFTATGIITTQEPTSLPPTNPPILKNLKTTLKVDKEFSPDMAENTSSAFRNFTKVFQAAISSIYTNLKTEDKDNFERVKVIQLGEGCILVTFIVYFKSEISRDKACAPLENEIKDGKLGKLKIVPYSLRCSKKKLSSPSPSAGLHPGIIAGLAVIGILAIAGLIITIIFVCRKKASKKDYRSSTGPGQGYEMEARHGEPEEQYASVQRPNASDAKQSPENDQPLPQYAAVDKTKKTKKKTKEPGELIYAQLDHDYNASVGTKPPSDRRSTGETGDTVYADIQGDKKKQRYPPPQYGNIHDTSYA